MPKKKEKSSEEYYKGKLREAEKQIRQLERNLKELQKREHPKKSKEQEVAPEICGECGKGELRVIEIIGKGFQVCDVCGHRKKIYG
jgi:hypothetical protein